MKTTKFLLMPAAAVAVTCGVSSARATNSRRRPHARHEGHPNLKVPQMNTPKPAMAIRDGLGIAAPASNHLEDNPMVTVVDDDRSMLKALSRLFRCGGLLGEHL